MSTKSAKPNSGKRTPRPKSLKQAKKTGGGVKAPERPTAIPTNGGKLALEVGHVSDVRKTKRGVRKSACGHDAKVDRDGIHRQTQARGHRPVGEELIELTVQVRSAVQGLRGLLVDALGRKMQLGVLLSQARGLCKGKQGAWAAFLNECQINERTAREAIQFHDKRDQIGAMGRHDGAALTVTAVRYRLARPAKTIESSKAGQHDLETARPTDRGRHGPVTAGGAPRRADSARSLQSDPPGDDTGPAGKRPEGQVVAVAIRQPDPVNLDSQPLTGEKSCEFEEPEDIDWFCDRTRKFIDKRIAGMGAADNQPVLAALERAATMLRDGIRRFHEADQAAGGPTR